jgi:hypothetical protein
MAINFPSSPTDGQVFADSNTNLAWVYSSASTAWSASFNRSNYVSQTFTATAGQTSFTVSGGYLPTLVEVYQNGVLLVNGTDVTVTSGTAVVLAVGAVVGDIIQVIGSTTFNYAATVPVSKGGTGLTSPGANGNVLTSDGTNWTSAAVGAPVGSLLPAPYAVYTTTATSGTGTTATITFTPATTIPVGSIVRVSGVTPSGYNGTYTVTASSSGSVSFASSTTGSQTVAGSFFSTPSGYLYCDGAIYNRSAYPALSGVIGTPFLASTQTTNYTNASFITSGGAWYETDQSVAQGVWAANGYLFTNGTVGRSTDQATPISGAMLYSTDGVNWTAATSYSIFGTRYACDQVAYGNGVYVMAGKNLVGGNQNIQYASSPGGTWTRATVGAAGNSGTGMLAFGGTANVFLVAVYNDACGPSINTIYYSTNGSTWTVTPTVLGFTGADPRGIAAYSGGVVVGNGAAPTYNLWYSATGTSGYTNISASVGSPDWVYNVSYGNGIFVVRTSNGTWTSTTGASGTWTKVSTVGGYNYQPLRWSGAAWVDSAGGRYTKNLIDYGYVPSILAATAVLGGRAYNKVNKTISSYDFSSYTTATQFPVPTITNGVAQTGVLLESGAQSFGYFIKT